MSRGRGRGRGVGRGWRWGCGWCSCWVGVGVLTSGFCVAMSCDAEHGENTTEASVVLMGADRRQGLGRVKYSAEVIRVFGLLSKCWGNCGVGSRCGMIEGTCLGRLAFLAPLPYSAYFGHNYVLGLGERVSHGVPKDRIVVEVSIGVQNLAMTQGLLVEIPSDKVGSRVGAEPMSGVWVTGTVGALVMGAADGQRRTDEELTVIGNSGCAGSASWVDASV